MAATAAALLHGGAVPAASGPVEQALQARIVQLRTGREVSVDGARIAARRLIADFYHHRGLRAAWIRPEQSQSLLQLLEGSTGHGLDPADYHLEALRRLATESPTAQAAADRELLLTDALIRFAYHLYFGKANPRELYPGWSFQRSLGAIDPVSALERLMAARRLGDAVEGLAPQLPAYGQLREALGRLHAIQASGGWPQIAAGATLRPGMRQARIQALRARLAASGDLGVQAHGDPLHFDAALESAVRRFQSRHGLDPDGAIGRRTLQALNVSVAARIEQVRVNLERLRWVAQDLAGDALIVDVAGFTARLMLDGRPVWSSRVVVGRPYRRTPVFRATMRTIVLNPSWTVPPTILREDILPKAMRDPGHLERNHMRVVDAAGNPVEAARLDWARYRDHAFPYQIVQAPGDDNALGKIKFLLPNPHAVYLHDTPTRRLFARPERAFSSGCIRLERPLELAVLLLDDAERWNAQALQAAIATRETLTLPAKRRVPVLILYFTAEADEAGTLRFHPDLYGRDARVAAALAAPFRFAPVDRARQR